MHPFRRKIDIESCHCEQSEAISSFVIRLPRILRVLAMTVIQGF